MFYKLMIFEYVIGYVLDPPPPYGIAVCLSVCLYKTVNFIPSLMGSSVQNWYHTNNTDTPSCLSI